MKVIKLIFGVICIVLIGCDPSDNRLKFINHSRQAVIVEISNDSSHFQFNNIDYYRRNVVRRDSVLVFAKVGSHHAMVDYVERSQDKKLYVAVFSIDSIENVHNYLDLNHLYQKKKYLKLLVYSDRDLIESNWRIFFK